MPSPSNPKFCGRCGQQTSISAKFCGHCGVRRTNSELDIRSLEKEGHSVVSQTRHHPTQVQQSEKKTTIGEYIGTALGAAFGLVMALAIAAGLVVAAIDLLASNSPSNQTTPIPQTVKIPTAERILTKS